MINAGVGIDKISIFMRNQHFIGLKKAQHDNDCLKSS